MPKQKRKSTTSATAAPATRRRKLDEATVGTPSEEVGADALRSFVENLPFDVLVEIFVEAGPVDQFTRLSLVCRRFREVVHTNLFYRMHWRRWFGGDPIEIERGALRDPDAAPERKRRAREWFGPNGADEFEPTPDRLLDITKTAMDEWVARFGRSYPLFEEELGNRARVVMFPGKKVKKLAWIVKHPHSGALWGHDAQGDLTLSKTAFLRNVLAYAAYEGYHAVALRLLRCHREGLTNDWWDSEWDSDPFLTEVEYPGQPVKRTLLDLSVQRAPTSSTEALHEFFLRDLKRLLDEIDDDGEVLRAALEGDDALFRRFVEEGFDYNSRPEWATPIAVLLASKGRVETLSWLMDRPGFDIEPHTAFDVLSELDALASPCEELIERLVRWCAAYDDQIPPALSKFALRRSESGLVVPTLRLLVELGLDLSDYPDHRCFRPSALWSKGRVRGVMANADDLAVVVGMLLEAGVDPLDGWETGASVLQDVLKLGKDAKSSAATTELFRLILESKRDATSGRIPEVFLGLSNVGGDTPLVVACRHGARAAAKMLVAEGADPNGTTHKVPLCTAARRGLFDIVGDLLDAGADPDRVDNLGLTALLTCAFEDRRYGLWDTWSKDDVVAREKCASRLIAHGADPTQLHAGTNQSVPEAFDRLAKAHALDKTEHGWAGVLREAARLRETLRNAGKTERPPLHLDYPGADPAFRKKYLTFAQAG